MVGTQNARIASMARMGGTIGNAGCDSGHRIAGLHHARSGRRRFAYPAACLDTDMGLSAMPYHTQDRLDSVRAMKKARMTGWKACPGLLCWLIKMDEEQRL